MRRPILGLSLLLAAAGAPAMAQDGANAACLATTQPSAIHQALLGFGGVAVDALPGTQVLPAGGRGQVLLNRPTTDGERIEYRVLVQRGNSDTPMAQDLQLLSAAGATAMTVPADHPRRAALPQPDKATLVSFPMPSLGSFFWDAFWGNRTIYVFGCNAARNLVFTTQVFATASDRIVSIVLTLLLLAVIYGLLAQFSRRADALPAPQAVPASPQAAAPLPGRAPMPITSTPRYGPGQAQRGFLRYLDPVLLTEGPNGRGSLSRLQVFFFSILVSGLLAYIVMRTGVLSDLSSSILMLLGISGVSAVASAATDVNRNRLAPDNWAWLVQRGWLQPSGLAAEHTAQWRDLVTSDGAFDVYRFQMLIFSLVVGGALLTTGLTDLASFKVPETLLGVLGLSQVVYIGGKLASPPSCADLDAAIADLRQKEDTFIALMVQGQASLTPLQVAAKPVAQAAYQTAMDKVWTLFQATLGTDLTTKDTADRTLHTA